MLIEGTRLHLGVVAALVAAPVIWFLIMRTTLGFRIRVTGENPEAARYGGINVERVLISTALLSGALAGLAGVGEVGGVHFQVMSDISPGYGYSGIVVAMLARLNPLGVVPAAIFLAAVMTGAEAMSRATGVPAFLSDVIQGTALLAMLVALLFTAYRVRRVGAATMSVVLEQIFQVGFLAAIIRIATPLAFATLGEMFSERAGVLNLGIEGIMLLSAMTGFTATSLSGSLWLGVLAAVLTGMLMGALHALFTVALGFSQHVCGIGVTLFSSGLAYFLYRLIFGQQSVPPNIKGFETLPIPSSPTSRCSGRRCSTSLRWSTWRCWPYRSPPSCSTARHGACRCAWSAKIRAPPNSAGVSVIATRFQAVILGGALMGLAGAFLSMAQFNAFTFGVVSGRGWVAIALVVFGRWDPWRSAGAALLFAFVDALQLRMQASGLGHIPYEAFLMLPFIFTIVAMAVMSRNAVAPVGAAQAVPKGGALTVRQRPMPHIAVKPLSTNRCAPLTKLASSLARNSAACATSSGSPMRPCCAASAASETSTPSLLQLGDFAQAVRRADEAGADRVAADVAVAELDGDGAREHVAGALGGVVEHLHRRRRRPPRSTRCRRSSRRRPRSCRAARRASSGTSSGH